MPRATIWIPTEHKDLTSRIKAAGINISAVCTAALLAAADDPRSVPDEHMKPMSLRAEVEMLRERVAQLEERAR